MLKIIKNEKIYIPVKEIEDLIIDIEKVLESALLIEDFGYVISESDYNLFLKEGIIRNDKDYLDLEMTKVHSLAVKIKDIYQLNPLKVLLLSNLGLSDEQILNKLNHENEDDIQKAIQQISKKNFKLESYIKKKIFIEKNKIQIEKCLGNVGLQLEILTLVQEGNICTRYYLVGKNVFYEIPFETLNDDESLNSFEKREDVLVFLDYYEEDKVHINVTLKDIDRDFSKYNVLQNIFWCVTHLSMKNDFSDEVSYYKDGIHLSVNIKLLLKFINSNAFPDLLYIEGMPEIEEHIIINE